MIEKTHRLRLTRQRGDERMRADINAKFRGSAPGDRQQGGKKLRKLILLAAMLAMALAAAAPVLAQGAGAGTGNINQVNTQIGAGNIVQQCVANFGDQNANQSASVGQSNQQDQTVDQNV